MGAPLSVLSVSIRLFALTPKYWFIFGAGRLGGIPRVLPYPSPQITLQQITGTSWTDDS